MSKRKTMVSLRDYLYPIIAKQYLSFKLLALNFKLIAYFYLSLSRVACKSGGKGEVNSNFFPVLGDKNSKLKA